MAELTGHSCLSDVLDRARDCHVRKLALVHTNPYGNIHETIQLPEAIVGNGKVVVPHDLDELEF